VFVRTKTFRRKDGSKRRYVYLVENKRINGKTKQITRANLGRLEDIQTQLPSIIKSLVKITDTMQVLNLGRELKPEWTREYGLKLIFEKLWEDMGFGEIMRMFAKDTRYEFNLEQSLFTLVLNRLMDPHSKLGVHDWVNEVYGLEQQELHQWYRSLDFLVKYKENIEKQIFHQMRNLFNADLDLVLFDTTSIVYWGKGEKSNELLNYGFSKQKRFDLKQVIVGVLMTKEGVPIGHEVYPGNTNDITAFKMMLESVKRKYALRRVVFVCDRGMVSRENLEILEAEKYEYIVGVRMRKMKKEIQDEFLDKADMQKVKEKDNLYAKEITREGKRYFICYNPERAVIDKERRDALLLKLEEHLKTKGFKSLMLKKEYSKFLQVEAEKPEIDKTKVKRDALFDGKYILASNIPEHKLSHKQAILYYKDLWQIEAGFRQLKNELELGPMYHWTETRIRGHIFICFLALCLRIVFSKKLKMLHKHTSVDKVLNDVNKLKVVKITLKDIEYIMRTEFEGDTNLAFKALNLKPPNRVIYTNSDSVEIVVQRFL